PAQRLGLALVGGEDVVALERSQTGPGAGQTAADGAVLVLGEVAGLPRRRLRPRRRLPAAAAVGRDEHARGALAGRVAGQEPGLVVHETHQLEAGQRVDEHAPPVLALVLGVEQYAGAAAARKLLAARDPADIGVDEANGAERGADAAGHAVPFAAGVNGV